MASFFKTATVNAASVPSTQTNFPTYIDLSRIGITTLAEAQSVRVYLDAAKTIEVAREIVSVSECHAKIPSLTSTVQIWIDADGTSADYGVTDTYGRNAVWSGFTSVYHMDSVTADSTVNANTLTNTGSTGNTTGKLNGSAADFGTPNTTKKLTIGGNIGIGGNGSISMSQWFQTGSTPTPGNQPVLISHRSTTGSDRYIDTYYRNDAGTLSIYTGEGGIKTARYIITLTHNTWYKLRTERDVSAGIYRIYLDGVLQASSSAPLPTGTAGQNGFVIAEFVGGGGFWWSGLQDEVRVTTTIPSADWETTEYNNQNNESSFWGTWSDVATAKRGAILLDY
jgi:hypothetical protein